MSAICERPETRRLINVISSSISALGWEDSTLTVMFLNGTTYAYDDVPYAVFERLLAADSIGREFNHTVKGRYPYHLMTRKEKPVTEETSARVRKSKSATPA